MSPDGVIARLVGGPTTEFISGIEEVIRGASGLEMSITVRVSLPGSRKIGLAFSSHACFSSFPTIKTCANARDESPAARPQIRIAMAVIPPNLDEAIFPLHRISPSIMRTHPRRTNPDAYPTWGG